MQLQQAITIYHCRLTWRIARYNHNYKLIPTTQQYMTYRPAPTTLMPLTLSPHNAVGSSHQPTHEPRIQTQLTQGAPHLPAVPSGLILSPADEPFPRKLVEVIARQFVDMRELLPDNISGPASSAGIGSVPYSCSDAWTNQTPAETGPLGNRPPRTPLFDGTPSFPDSRRLPYGAKQTARRQPFVLYAGVLTTSNHNVPWHTSTHSLCEPRLRSDKPATGQLVGQKTFASLGIRGRAFSRILVHTCRHVCMACQLHHMARDCPKTPQNSFYKQVPSQSTPKQAAQATQR